jgi:ribosome assembly protein YihI (activator of Der GTPase)
MGEKAVRNKAKLSKRRKKKHRTVTTKSNKQNSNQKSTATFEDPMIGLHLHTPLRPKAQFYETV